MPLGSRGSEPISRELDMDQSDQPTMTTTEASHLLGLSLVWIRSFIRHGELRESGEDRVVAADVLALARRLREQGRREAGRDP